MKRLVLIGALAGCLLIPSTALALEVATAHWVQQQLTIQWRTSDGYRVRSAVCTPTNRFSVRDGRILSNRWDCLEVDTLSRVFWVHAHVANSSRGHLASVTSYRCSAKSSSHACP